MEKGATVTYYISMCLVTQSCPTLCDFINSSPPGMSFVTEKHNYESTMGSSAYGIGLQPQKNTTFRKYDLFILTEMKQFIPL